MTATRSHANLFDSTGTPLARLPDAVRAGANAAIFNERGQLVMQKRSDNGFWCMPGGNMEPGESISDCAVREAFEETGLVVAVKRLVGIYSDPATYNVMRYPDNSLIQYVIVLFECEYVSGELRLSEEGTDLAWFDPDKLPENTLLSHRIRIKDALASSGAPFVR
jgi:8-oxo-dGTP pyrophosphatase MutT (NUDIX family)